MVSSGNKAFVPTGYISVSAIDIYLSAEYLNIVIVLYI